MDIDYSNKWFVASTTRGVVIMRPPQGPLAPEDAIVLAAWLKLIAELSSSITFAQAEEEVSR